MYIMGKSTKNKPLKITADFVIEKYLEAKKLKGIKHKKAMSYVIFLSQNLNKYILQEN